MNREDQSINLLRVQSVLSNVETAFLLRLRLISIVMTIVVLTIGAFIGTAYLAAKLRLDTVTNDKSNALKILSYNSKKEALLLGLKDRIPLIDKAVESQYPWDKIMDTVSGIVSPPQLQGLTIDTKNTLKLEVDLGSLEEMNDIVGKTKEMVKSKQIKNPRIESLNADKNGKIKVSVMFTPVF